MKKTLNINLGGLAFIIDENAFELLHNYLEELKRKFGNEAEREEIMADIEARIAEMLAQKLEGRKEVLSIDDVQLVIATMGKPEDIAGDEAPTTSEATTAGTFVTTGPVKKRLYRDPDDAKVGGVIAGLCHYFGINDPTWARIAIIVLVLMSYGSIILLYFLLLIVVPKANTAAEKLQMKGEPVNVATIEREVKEAAGRAGDSVRQLVKDENFFERLWDMVVSIFRVAFKIVAAFAIIISMILLIAIFFTFTAFYFLGTSPFNGISYMLVDKTSTVTLFSLGYLLTTATVVIAIIYASLRIILGQRSRVKWLKWTLLTGFIAGIIMLSVFGLHMAVNFGSNAVHKTQLSVQQPSCGKLYVQLVDADGNKAVDDNSDPDINLKEDGVYINGVNFKDMPQIPIGKPSLQLITSDNDSFYIQEVVSSQGKTKSDADKNAKMVNYSFHQNDSVLNLDQTVYLAKDSKYRAQGLKIQLAIPEGKKVHFANNIDQWETTVKGDSKYDDTGFANTTWTVEKGIIKCLKGENHDDEGVVDKETEKKSAAKEEKDDNEDKEEKNKDF